MKEFEGKTDDELETLREASAENSYVPGSIFHRVTRELERRHQKRVEESLQRPHQTIGILNQGKNNKFIGNTFDGFDIGIKDQGELTYAHGNKFQKGMNNSKEWYEKPFGIILLMVIAGLIIAGVVFYLHWN